MMGAFLPSPEYAESSWSETSSDDPDFSMYLFSVVCFVFYFIINVYPLLLLITSTPVSIIFEAVYFPLVNLS